MESSIGAPTPEELARLSIEERCELRKKADDVKEPLPSDEKDDCDSAEEAVSEGTVRCQAVLETIYKKAVVMV